MELRLLLLVQTLAAVYDIAYFQTGFFQPYRDPGLYEVTVGLENQDRQLALYGYFNGDK